MSNKGRQVGNSGAGLHRRQFLQAGGSGLVGLGTSGWGQPLPVQAGPKRPAQNSTFGRAKSIVILYLYGAPSQMDTLDPKPLAPAETRGEFQTISSSLPGVAVCEHLPNLARNLHRVALVRSMSHTSNNHAVSVALSGLSKSTPALEGNNNDPRHQPYIGSVLEYLWKRQGISFQASGLPVNMVLPWQVNQKTGPGRWIPHGAWLGKSYNPVVPLFVGKASRGVGSPSVQGSTSILSRFDPWDGITPQSTFRFDGAELPADVPKSRFSGRRRLLETLGSQGGQFAPAGRAFGQYQDLAFAMITEPKIAHALDVTREPDRIRRKYGLTLWGQSALTARRLVEVGVKLVTVFWDTWGDNNSAWDTHFNHFPRLRDGLCPKLDSTLPAFLDDMQERGLLDETLVMVISCHGRTPTISPLSNGAGRGHWAGAYCGMFFGAGIRTGQVIGATDKQGGYPVTNPIDPKDILATMYHLLGFDPHQTTVPNRLARPMHLIPHGDVVESLLS